MSPELPPQVGLSVLKRGLVAAVLIILMTGSAVAAAGFLEFDRLRDIADTESKLAGRETIDVPELTRPDAGEPRTIMMLGSDQRYADKQMGIKPRSDTIILARLDPDTDAITMLSLPRDLKVQVPGHGTQKINSAYELGGIRLAIKTVQRLLSTPERGDFEINHVVNVDFGGFRRMVNYLGCVYADVDRDYFNDNLQGGELYATIDIDPGYQKLCGRDALDYVRHRHSDNDLFRAARQQDFLRQMRNQSGIRKRLNLDARDEIVKIMARYTDRDKSLRESDTVLSLLKLGLFIRNKPIQEVRIRNFADDGSYLTASSEAIDRAVDEFFEGKGTGGVRASGKDSKADKAFRKRKRRGTRRSDVPGLEVNKKAGEDQAILSANKIDFPMYFPTLRAVGSGYVGNKPRTYSIRDELGGRHRAYRMVLYYGQIGEYYGVQGMTWMDPPILDGPHETRMVEGRRLLIYRDGRRVRLVAWKTKKALYYVHNTLGRKLNARQMIAIAASLRHLGQ